MMPRSRNPSIARRFAGQRSNRRGDWFEKVIMASVCDELGPILQLEALPKCGARFIGAGKSINRRIVCDFVGSVVGSGRGIFFDAKSSEHSSGFELANPKIVKPHQTIALHAQAHAGAIAGLVVECRERREYLWLDGRHLGPLRKTIRWDDSRWLRIGDMAHRVRFRDLISHYALPREIKT